MTITPKGTGKVNVSGDLTITGDDLFMNTNTSGAALIGDGTNYNPVVISGDISIGTTGTAAIGSGVIVNADINASAAITDSKLATISTTDKVSAASVQIDGATDGTASGTGITLADADKILVDDNGTTTYIEASQLKAYTDASFASDNLSTGDAAVTIGTSSGSITLDTPTDIILDADGSDIFFKDGGTTFGSATNNSGDLILKSGTTTAATFSGADVTLAGGITVATGNLTYSGTAVTSTGAELNLLDGSVLGTPTASKAVIADANQNIGAVKGTELHIGTSGSETQETSTGAELNLLDGSSAGTIANSK